MRIISVFIGLLFVANLSQAKAYNCKLADGFVTLEFEVARLDQSKLKDASDIAITERGPVGIVTTLNYEGVPVSNIYKKDLEYTLKDVYTRGTEMLILDADTLQMTKIRTLMFPFGSIVHELYECAITQNY